MGSDCVIVGSSLPSGYSHPTTEDGCIINEFGMKMCQGPLHMEVIEAPLANVSSVDKVKEFPLPDPLAEIGNLELKHNMQYILLSPTYCGYARRNNLYI